jgi:predicted amidohydrolase
MRIAIVQSNPKFGDTRRNLESIHRIIDTVETDLIVFPELATSGYFFTSKNQIFDHAFVWNESPELLEIQSISTRKNTIIVLGFPEKDGELFYNSAGIFMPNCTLSRVYRKTHLFYKEKCVFEPGNSGFFCVYDDHHDCVIGVMVCYDWRFPEAARSLALQGADLILCPSNLVTSLSSKVFPARAIENKVYIAVANRVGEESKEEEKLKFQGESAIYDFNGERIAMASKEEEEVVYAEIFPEKTRNKGINCVNDIFKDRIWGMYRKG